MAGVMMDSVAFEFESRLCYPPNEVNWKYFLFSIVIISKLWPDLLTDGSSLEFTGNSLISVYYSILRA